LDPDGRLVKLAGKVEDQRLFLEKAEESTGLKVSIGKDGILSATGDVNNGAAKAFMDAINSDQAIGIEIVRNDRNLHIDDYPTGKLDVGDLAKISDASPRWGQATLAHVFVEHRVGMEMGGKTRKTWLGGAHKAGLAAENAVMGATHRFDNSRSWMRRMFDLNYEVTYELNGRVIGNYDVRLDDE